MNSAPGSTTGPQAMLYVRKAEYEWPGANKAPRLRGAFMSSSSVFRACRVLYFLIR